MTATSAIEASPVDPAGSFGGTALAGGRVIDPAQWASDEPILGLIREAGYMWGSVRDVETGDLFSVMRRWYSWANHYADGVVEVGHFLFGQRDFHVGLLASSDGSVRAARRMDAVVTRDPDGYWHQGLSYDLDGAAWVCEPDPRGRMSGLGPLPNPQQEGRIRRVGDDRAVEAWMAWGESVPANGETRI